LDEKTKQTITVLLRRIEEGDNGAEDQLFDLVYADLHHAAERCLSPQKSSHTLQSTDLVHEAYAKLFAKRRMKRAPAGERVALDSLVAKFEDRTIDVLDLNEALDALAADDARAAQVVELRLFAGLSVDEVAGVLGLPKRAVERDWTYARIQLQRRMG
jgi:DNA-directed RNA polymerase specialized sigma24 family protein